MRIVIALGGNALLKRGEPMTAGRQRSNVRVAAAALARVATDHELVISHGIDRPLATLLTMVEVDPDDPAFADPTKFVGPIYDEATAKALAADKGWHVKPDGKSWRRVVPSPRPKRIFEIRPMRWLLEQGTVVICAGGGGIPTMYA